MYVNRGPAKSPVANCKRAEASGRVALRRAIHKFLVDYDTQAFVGLKPLAEAPK